MATHHNEFVNVSGLHPLLAFGVSLFMMGVTQIMPQINSQWHLPPIIMELSQVLAWWCVGGTFLIAVLNFLDINPFKKKKGKK